MMKRMYLAFALIYLVMFMVIMYEKSQPFVSTRVACPEKARSCDVGIFRKDSIDSLKLEPGTIMYLVENY